MAVLLCKSTWACREGHKLPKQLHIYRAECLLSLFTTEEETKRVNLLVYCSCAFACVEFIFR